MNRRYGALTAPEIGTRFDAHTVLCLPIGSYEQHGPHLPLHTDTIIAERFAQRLIERYGDEHDLWLLPTLPYGLSLEHTWTTGTISLRAGLLTSLLDLIVAEYVRATPARKLVIVNGHGGNRGILEAAVYELERSHGVRTCVVHPASLSTAQVESALPEIHAGVRETSVMLALAPRDVHLERLDDAYALDEGQAGDIERLVLDRGTTWAWSSGDKRIGVLGVIGGDPRTATRELGERLLASALDACGAVLERL